MPKRQSPCTHHRPDGKEECLSSQLPRSHHRSIYTTKSIQSIPEKTPFPLSPSTPLPPSIHPSTPQDPDLEAQLLPLPDRSLLRHSRLSGLLELRGSPKSFGSREGSETSDFSSLVFGIRKSPSSASRRCPPRKVGEMSLAKLTSGVADGGWGSR